ncbi:MAG: nucleotidyl transferase AbiEii/AbiGii toxin family protein [Acidobacteriota bacterium]|nr:nucleotidyl transferase AbiEii/AbiGii toxin family protein [Acidobacteriota bacterium]
MANWPEFKPIPLLRELVAHGVDFVVIGGIAMIGHGSARLTRDLDIVYAADAANLEALGEVMVGLGARLRGIEEEIPFVPDPRTLRQTSILTLDTPLGWIDLRVSPAGSPAYAQLRARADRITTDGISFLIASLDDLESMKRAAGRPKDLLDLEEIEVIRRLRRRLRLS